MSAPSSELLRAVDLALAGDWQAAHQLVQQYEDDVTAVWIHAVLHKIEGDPGNAGYWYCLAGRMNHLSDEPMAELALIKAGTDWDKLAAERRENKAPAWDGLP